MVEPLTEPLNQTQSFTTVPRAQSTNDNYTKFDLPLTTSETEIRTTPYRWVIALGLFGLILNAIMATQIVSAVSVLVSTALEIDFFWVQFSMLSCNLVIIPMNFGASSLYNAWPQRWVLYFSCML